MGGLTGLMAALFFFAWSGFDLVAALILAMPLIFRGLSFSRVIGAKAEGEPITSQSRNLFDTNISKWSLLALLLLVVVLAILGALRIAALGHGSMRFTAGSDAERWLPLLLTTLVPFWFVISGVLDRLPRHFLAGATGLVGAITGPAIGLAWRDSLALAAAVMGLILIADGLIARSQSCGTA